MKIFFMQKPKNITISVHYFLLFEKKRNIYNISVLHINKPQNHEAFIVIIINYKLWVFLLFLKKTLWPLFMDGVQLPQGKCHFEEAV